MKTLSILFAGEAITARLLDGSEQSVFVRALPQRFLGHVLNACEFSHAMIELCTYIKSETQPEEPAYPDMPAPAGYAPVPRGWSDNLSDEGATALYDLAQKLNFQRAAKWAEGQIAAKKLVAPLHESAMNQMLPVIDRIMGPLMRKLDSLSISTPSAPSSSAAGAKSS